MPHTRPQTLQDTQKRPDYLVPVEHSCQCGQPPEAARVMVVTKPEYHQGELTARLILNHVTDEQQYKVEWSPHVCIDSQENQENEFRAVLHGILRGRMLRLNKLRFNCRYVVKLSKLKDLNNKDDNQMIWSNNNRMSRRGSRLQDGDTITTCFCTPSCKEVEVSWGSLPPDCPKTSPGPPSPPSKLRVENVDASRLDYRISWEAPTDKEENEGNKQVTTTNGGSSRYANHKANVFQPASLTKYRVVWAPRTEEPVNKEMYNDDAGFSPIFDFQQSDVRVVDKNQTWLLLRELKPDTFYIVHVQVLAFTEEGKESESSPATVYFITPTQGKLREIGQLVSTLDGNAASPISRGISLWLKVITALFIIHAVADGALV